MVERVVQYMSLLVEWISCVDGVCSSTGDTATNDSGDDDANKYTSTDGGSQDCLVTEERRARVHIVAASLV